MQAAAQMFLQDAASMAEDTMLYWLAQTAKELREQAGRKQVHIAAAMSTDQSTIYRFEQGRTWPRRTDALIAAYADDLDIEDPRDIWNHALQLWLERGDAPSVETGPTEAGALPGPGGELQRRVRAASPTSPGPDRPRSQGRGGRRKSA